MTSPRLIQAREHAIVLIRVHGDLPLLGQVIYCESPKGSVFPSVNLSAQGYVLPLLVLADSSPDQALQFEVLNTTVAEYFTQDHRQRLAADYRTFCLMEGWPVDDLATLNAVYYLEANGFSIITPETARHAAVVMRATRKAFYQLCQVLHDQFAAAH